MKTKIVFAALAAIAAFAAPSATAERYNPDTMKVTFVYKTNAAPEAIYAQLERKARRACEGTAIMSAGAMRAVETCKASLMEAAIDKIGRMDIAAVHYREMATQVAGAWVVG
jgi:UrcA family protein